MRRSPLFATGLCVALLAGCHSAPPAATGPAHESEAGTAPDEAAPVFTDRSLGLALPAMAGMQLKRDFHRSYLDNGAWKSYAAPDSEGSPVAALVMDGSNHIIAAELRIGASHAGSEIGRCRASPDSAVPGSVDDVTLDGVTFRHFRAADAAMSHYMQVESYRAVRNGQCLAIDLLLTGTNPSAYPDPPPVPFTQAQAWAKLHKALDGVRFER